MQIILLACAVTIAVSAPVRPIAAEAPSTAPAVKLPGNGLAEHDFLYAGESKQRRAHIVRKGQVVWAYDAPTGRGEVSDAVLLSNGNLLLAHQYAVKLVSPHRKVLWAVDSVIWPRWPESTPEGGRCSWGASRAVVLLQATQPTEPRQGVSPKQPPETSQRKSREKCPR